MLQRVWQRQSNRALPDRQTILPLGKLVTKSNKINKINKNGAYF
jgi:hypothetical protein